MADLRVTPEVLLQVSTEFGTAEQRLRDGLGVLDSEVSQMLGSSWIGGAASAYDAVWREWHEGSSKVLRGLTAMSNLLSSAAARYTGTDGDGGAAIAGSGM
ncbi:WXG100 family type VII secretion target [Mycobacterium sp. DL440]|uniref:WXG100 family type VII secretion target n=1 Tax=Mycobacterium sp. DL440 TaxID=2675523 RepID=UPI00141EAB14|nr:WXG100 family type VII secretion target [Mycobacterium sp. DL440]